MLKNNRKHICTHVCTQAHTQIQARTHTHILDLSSYLSSWYWFYRKAFSVCVSFMIFFLPRHNKTRVNHHPFLSPDHCQKNTYLKVDKHGLISWTSSPGFNIHNTFLHTASYIADHRPISAGWQGAGWQNSDSSNMQWPNINLKSRTTRSKVSQAEFACVALWVSGDNFWFCMQELRVHIVLRMLSHHAVTNAIPQLSFQTAVLWTAMLPLYT